MRVGIFISLIHNLLVVVLLTLPTNYSNRLERFFTIVVAGLLRQFGYHQGVVEADASVMLRERPQSGVPPFGSAPVEALHPVLTQMTIGSQTLPFCFSAMLA
jgi:hypothetical protein